MVGPLTQWLPEFPGAYVLATGRARRTPVKTDSTRIESIVTTAHSKNKAVLLAGASTSVAAQNASANHNVPFSAAAQATMGRW